MPSYEVDRVDADGTLRRAMPSHGTPFPLGRHLVHDPRSRGYRAVAAPGRLRTVFHAHAGRVLNQRRLGSCTGNSGAQCMNTAPLHRHGDPVWVERDAVQLYSDATRVDQWAGTYPPDDTGSSGLAVGRVLKARGTISRYEWGFGIDDALALAATDVLSVGTGWTDSMFSPDEAGFITPAGDDVGGHQYTIRGIDAEQEWVLILNSWGSGWGGWTEPTTGKRMYPGHARMRFADLAARLAGGGDVVRFVR